MAQAICESTTFNMQKRSNRPPDASLLALCAEAAAIEAKIDAIGDTTRDDDFEEERLTEPMYQALDLVGLEPRRHRCDPSAGFQRR
jgi:hypothetical protein